jgi:hypothetical protein
VGHLTAILLSTCLPMTNTQAVSENHRPCLGLGEPASKSDSKTHRWVWWLALDSACLPPTTAEDATGMLTDDAVHEEDARGGCLLFRSENVAGY